MKKQEAKFIINTTKQRTKVEAIGDKTKTTYTDVNDYSTVAFMDCNAAYFSVKK